MRCAVPVLLPREVSVSTEATASSATAITQTPTSGLFFEGSAAAISGTKHVATTHTTLVFWPKATTSRASALDVDPAAKFGQFVAVEGGGADVVASRAMWMSDDAVVGTNELSACQPLRAPPSAQHLRFLVGLLIRAAERHSRAGGAQHHRGSRESRIGRCGCAAPRRFPPGAVFRLALTITVRRHGQERTTGCRIEPRRRL